MKRLSRRLLVVISIASALAGLIVLDANVQVDLTRPTVATR